MRMNGFWIPIEFWLLASLYTIKFFFAFVIKFSFSKFKPSCLLLNVKVELSVSGIVRILNSKLKSWESKSPLKTQTHSISICPNWSSDVNYQDRKLFDIGLRIKQMRSFRVFSSYPLVYALFRISFFLLGRFIFFFGVIILRIVRCVVAMSCQGPCRARSTLFYVLSCVFECFSCCWLKLIRIVALD